MLAERTRVLVTAAIAVAVAVTVTAIAMTRDARRATAIVKVTPVDAPNHICQRDYVPPQAAPDEPARIIAKLRGVPERTGKVVESDWARSYRVVWDGPIETWTTMRDIRVPSLDRRSLAEVRPRYAGNVDAEHARWIVIDVRVVVPGDAEAALDEVRASPDVESADLDVR